MDKEIMISKLIEEVEKLRHRQELSKTVTPDYFEPGMMEYLDKSDGVFEPETGKLLLRFEVKGTRYDGRTEIIENVHVGDVIKVVRDSGNIFNHNNFTFENGTGQNVGNMPAELCNALAPFYDNGLLQIVTAVVSFVDPVSKRNRHAKQAILFIEITGHIDISEN